MTRKITVDCLFAEDGRLRATDGRYARDKEVIQSFNKKHAGKEGFLTLQVGARSRRLKLMRFFHGPLIDAYVRLTGDPDREAIKKFLKREYLVEYEERDGKMFAYVKSLRDVSDAEMVKFVNDCCDRLAHEGGHLTEYEKDEWDGTKTKKE